MNVLLIERLKSVSFQLAYRNAKKPVPGHVLPAMAVKDLSGRSVRVSFIEGQQATLVYVFSPSCHWCARNLENLKALYRKLDGEYRFVAVSLSAQGLDGYVREANMPAPVYHHPDNATFLAYDLGSTPETWLIAPGGALMRRWAGVWAGETGRQIGEQFGVRLPGLTPEVERQRQ